MRRAETVGCKVFHPALGTRKSALAAGLIAIALAACSSAPSRPGPSKTGGYYLDDGPGANPPADLDRIADPTPRREPINRATARPYTVLGTTYTPFTELTAYRARGGASWYGRRYHGQKTSSGEIYDMYAMSAAHTLLPLPSYARVTNLANGRSVVVRVNDRGPFHEDRIIDLSYAAAYKLGIVNHGSTTVEVEAIIPGDSAAPPTVAATAPTPLPTPLESEAGGVYVQLGAFSVADNAEVFLQKMRLDLPWLAATMQLYRRDGLYKIHAGPYQSRDAAQRDAERARQSLGFAPFVLSR
ncbi:MAG: septal ring lytic transglycosylase RlpA family protein [Burkholderiales bacterium]